MTLLILQPRLSQIALLIVSFAIGILPALFSYFFFSGNNTWDPSHPPFFVRDFYLNALGLNGIPDYISVVLPYALGLPPSQSFFTGAVQSGITWTVVLAVTITACVGWFQAVKHRKWPGHIVIISTSWLGAIFSIMLFVTFIDTVWFYATSLSILFWLSIGALPTSISPRWLALTICIVFLALEGISMLTHNWHFYSDLPNRIKEKAEYQNTINKQAQNLLDNGVEIVYGSYLDVIPLAYASSFELRPISNRYNRFPLSQEELSRNYRTAVKIDPTDLWGSESLAMTLESCLSTGKDVSHVDLYGIFACNGEDLQPKKSGQ